MKKHLITFTILLFPFLFFAQRNISGEVIKAGGGHLGAVKVYCKEAPAIFTFSDEKGIYKIEVPYEVHYLVFTYSGMNDRTVKLQDSENVNVVMVPSAYKKIRFGLGFSSGVSTFNLHTNNSYTNSFDTAISMTLISLSGNIFYRFHKRFDLQLNVEDGLNIAKIDTDSTYINEFGNEETVFYTQKIILNRFTSSLLFNVYLPFGKTKNHSWFAGIGPQFQHLSFLNTNTMGARIQTGFNINEYGFLTRLFIAIDASNGTFGEDNIYVPGLDYAYSGFRFGTVVIFK